MSDIDKQAAGAAKQQGRSRLKRDLEGTDPYNKDAVKHVVSMLSSLQKASQSLADALSVLGGISAHEISHDGMLGGRGYVMTIRDVRDDIATATGLVTNLIDTVSDEISNPKWELSPEESQRYKDEAKGSTNEAGPDAQEPTETPSPHSDDAVSEEPEGDMDLGQIMDMFGESAPSSHEEQQNEPAQDPAQAADLTPPSDDQAGVDAPPPDKGQGDTAAPPLEETPPEEAYQSAVDLPYRKLAALTRTLQADPVAMTLRVPIVYNILDGHTADEY